MVSGFSPGRGWRLGWGSCRRFQTHISFSLFLGPASPALDLALLTLLVTLMPLSPGSLLLIVLAGPPVPSAARHTLLSRRVMMLHWSGLAPADQDEQMTSRRAGNQRFRAPAPIISLTTCTLLAGNTGPVLCRPGAAAAQPGSYLVGLSSMDALRGLGPRASYGGDARLGS